MSGIRIIKIEDVTVAVADIDAGEGSRREAERAAVGRLVAEAIGTDVAVMHREDGAPYIFGGPHISISHSRDLAALAISPAHPVGIDAEQWRETLRRVAKKFLSDVEMELFTSDNELLRAWTIKEAVYKIAGGAALDFRHNIAITPDLATAHALGHDYRLHTFSIGAVTVTVAVPIQ